MEERYLKLQEILKDEATCRRLFVMDAKEAADVLKKEYDVEFTAEELADFMNGVKAAMNERGDGELGETDLEMVSGGRNQGAYNSGYSFGKMVPAGVLVGLAVAQVW